MWKNWRTATSFFQYFFFFAQMNKQTNDNGPTIRRKYLANIYCVQNLVKTWFIFHLYFFPDVLGNTNFRR